MRPAQGASFRFEPMVNIGISGIMAVEALPSCGTAGPADSHRSPDRSLAAQDGEMAVAGLCEFLECESMLPLHVNILASTVAHDLAWAEVLRAELHKAGRLEHEITVEIGPPMREVSVSCLLAGVDYLRNCGFRIALDGVGDSDVPPALVADVRPDVVKLHPNIVRSLPESRGRLGVLDAMNALCESTGSVLVAEGVEDDRQLALLRDHEVRRVQGPLFSSPTGLPPSTVSVPQRGALVDRTGEAITGPRASDFLSAATTLPLTTTADEVREVLNDHPDVESVVLVDEDRRPVHTLDRSRFLLSVTGPYGHALHAAKPASRLADKPRLVTTSTLAMNALETISQSSRERLYDDAVVVDESGRCLGVVRAIDLIRGIAAMRTDNAIALNPLTGLPGSDSIACEVRRCIDRRDSFTLGWLDVDSFKTVNDTVGFAAGDDLIRGLGRSLTDAATVLSSVKVAHVGGDDFLLFATAESDLQQFADQVLTPQREANGVAVTLSLATLECSGSTVSSYQEASQRLTPVKRIAKKVGGTSWVTSRLDDESIRVKRGHWPDDSSEDGQRPAASHDEAVRPNQPSVLTRLYRSSQRFTDLLAVAPVGIGLFDESESLVDANPALCDLLGYRLDKLRGMTVEHMTHPQFPATKRTNATAPASYRMLIRSDGQPVYCELHSALSVQDDGRQFWLMVFQDITERHQAAEALHHQATHDELTGLPNRAAINELLNDRLTAANPQRIAVLVCDIDNFKRINDALGHEAGDDVLRSLATRLENNVPDPCTVGRLSGDEFIVTCLDVDDLDGLATRLASLLRTAVPVKGEHLVRISASIGVAVSDDTITDGDDLVRFANAAKTEAQKRGPGHVALAGPDLITSTDQQVQLESQLRLALANDELHLHYQPVVDATGMTVGAEALVRWKRDDGTSVAPGTFLPVAEQGNLLRDLDRWVMRTALEEASAWPPGPDGTPIGISINVAGLTPDDPDFATEVAAMIDDSGIDWNRVVIEVVETELADIPAKQLSAMHRLVERGLRFAVDDFGTGYSSLARLQDLPAQIIKVDRRFVAEIDTDNTQLAVARAITDMAKAMGRRCVAEGVETAAQLRTLRELGIERYQGWLFSHDVPGGELRSLLGRPLPQFG
ncbi:EAL domain-containing protein [Saccharopolyspora karakumensis]|uniref:EAL domain-containing protein n=1 Tax=Saccharopolyspora karakumensis TaxID=2530386 RepID=UPI001404ED5E|nr:EAL domain-containing protein [Saccharopolyspora karakumensis]